MAAEEALLGGLAEHPMRPAGRSRQRLSAAAGKQRGASKGGHARTRSSRKQPYRRRGRKGCQPGPDGLNATACARDAMSAEASSTTLLVTTAISHGCTAKSKRFIADANSLARQAFVPRTANPRCMTRRHDLPDGADQDGGMDKVRRASWEIENGIKWIPRGASAMSTSSALVRPDR